MSKKYRCPFCEHLAIEYDVYTAMGDTHICEQWMCAYRDDERCVPGCVTFTPKRKAVNA